MSRWIKLIDISKLEEGESKCIELEGKAFGVFRLSNQFYVIDNLCPHKGAPLHEGFVQNGVVVCPWHQWEFQVSDGKCLSIPNQAVKSYVTEIRDSAVWVELSS